MEAKKHTAGKWNWKQTRGNNRFEHTVYCNQTVIAELNGEITEEIKANAQLIASAPELLEALIFVKGRLDNAGRGQYDAIAMLTVENAIQKATSNE